MDLPFDEPHVAGARTLLRVFRSELDPLPFAQQLEYRTPDRTAMEKVFDAALISDKTEPFVDQEASDCPGWHNPKPSRSEPPGISQGNSAGYGRLRLPRAVRTEAGRVLFQPKMSWKFGPV